MQAWPKVSTASLEQLQRPFLGMTALRQRLRDVGIDVDNGYYEVGDRALLKELLSGTLPIAQDGCGHHMRIVMHGEQAGDVLSVDNHGGVFSGDGFLSWLVRKLERHAGSLGRTWEALCAAQDVDAFVTRQNAAAVLTLLGRCDTFRTASERRQAATAAVKAWQRGEAIVSAVERLSPLEQCFLSWHTDHGGPRLPAGLSAALSWSKFGPRLGLTLRQGARRVSLSHRLALRYRDDIQEDVRMLDRTMGSDDAADVLASAVRWVTQGE